MEEELVLSDDEESPRRAAHPLGGGSVLRDDSSSDDDDDGGDLVLAPVVRPDLPDRWVVVETAAGEPYFVNYARNQSSWKAPVA